MGVIVKKYRIKKETYGDTSRYYPQFKKGWFWFDMYKYGFDTYQKAQKVICIEKNYLEEPVVEYLDFDPVED